MLLAVGTLNALMLLSIPVYGSHYLADMLVGALVALLSIYLIRAASRRSRASRRPGALLDQRTDAPSFSRSHKDAGGQLESEGHLLRL
jgi:hypothetical protein